MLLYVGDFSFFLVCELAHEQEKNPKKHKHIATLFDSNRFFVCELALNSTLFEIQISILIVK